MTKALYPYPADKGMARKDVVAYLMTKGAKKGQADRWTKDEYYIPNVGNYTWWNGIGFIHSTFFDPAVVKKITKRTVFKWLRQEAKERKKRRNRDNRKRKALSSIIESIPTAPVIVLDTETTGLLGSHEVIDLAIVDLNGNILFNARFRPVRHKFWPKASAVNGIYWDDVSDEYPFSVYRKIVQKIINAADKVIGYNISFDAHMLRNEGITIPGECVDIMEPFAEIYGEWNDYFQNYKWQKLTTCAHYYGYQWDEKKDAHGALADALATLYCYQQMQKNNVPVE